MEDSAASHVPGAPTPRKALRDAVARLPGAAVSRQTLVLIASLWLVAAANFPFWRSVWNATGGLDTDNFGFLLSLPPFVLAWTYLLLGLVAWGRATKAALGAALVMSAAVAYFANTYGVVLDDSMIASALQTDRAEAADLMSWRLWSWLFAFGALPALLIARVRVQARPWARELGVHALGMAVAIVCMAAVLLFNFQHYASLARNHRELRLVLVPNNIALALHGYLKHHLAAPIRMQAIGTDAVHPVAVAAGTKPTVTILVIGETARAANFSLNGYARPTNPELARERVVSFSNVSACGTSTAVSVPCMFSDVGRGDFDDTVVKRREGLLDVLQHASIQVLWRDNNSGCKGVCDRVPLEDVSALQDPRLCRDGECYDEVLLQGLQALLDRLERDAVIVLHMKGSHGPAYFKRYPSAYETFRPACRTIELDRCPRESIVNAYDNSLRYTDHVLGATIGLLKSNASRFDAALLYVSDHGESLGENGLYLHGIPYALAPREQIQVPMLLWLSEGLRDRLDIDTACLEALRQEPLSHDNLFHSVLGLTSVRTAAYRPERDLIRKCQSITTASHAGPG